MKILFITLAPFSSRVGRLACLVGELEGFLKRNEILRRVRL